MVSLHSPPSILVTCPPAMLPGYLAICCITVKTATVEHFSTYTYQRQQQTREQLLLKTRGEQTEQDPQWVANC